MAGATPVETWKQLVSHHFGKRTTRHWFTLASAITAVDCGLKPAYLCDSFLANPSAVANFLQQLKVAGKIRRPLRALAIGADTMVLDVEACARSLEAVIAREGVSLVDASSAREKPVLAEPEIVAKVTGHLRTILCQLSDSKEPATDEVQYQTKNEFLSLDASANLITLQLDAEWNVSTIFGLLLNYPAIYWYQTDSAEGADDCCLAMCPLRAYTVSAVTSSRVVECGGIASEESETRTTIYAFSVPECLATRLQVKVDSWFADLRTEFVSQSAFTDLLMEARLVTLPSVAL